MYKYQPGLESKENDCSRSTGFTFTGARDSLLNNSATEVGIDCPGVGEPSRLPKFGITDACLVCEARKRLCLINGQSFQDRWFH